MSRPYDPNETREQLAAALHRNHPELTGADVDRILAGEPARDKRDRANDPRKGWVDNRGKRTSRYEAVSAGRTTSNRGVTSEAKARGE